MIRVLLHRSAKMQRYIFLLTYRAMAVFETTAGIRFKNFPGLPSVLFAFSALTLLVG